MLLFGTDVVPAEDVGDSEDEDREAAVSGGDRLDCCCCPPTVIVVVEAAFVAVVEDAKVEKVGRALPGLTKVGVVADDPLDETVMIGTVADLPGKTDGEPEPNFKKKKELISCNEHLATSSLFPQ